MKKMLTAKAKLAVATILAVFATTVFAAPQVYYVNDVTSLTNVLSNLPDVTDDTYNGSRIELAPGVYDLAGVYMNANSHLYVKHARDLLITGTGTTPGDTVLLGGGSAGSHRVLEFAGGGDSWWNTVSNLTITGGYTIYGGAGAYSRSVATMFVDCVVSNNVATNGGNDWTGGAVKNGCAVRTYFAGNSAALAGGAIECGPYKSTMSLQPYTESCYFTNNTVTTANNDFGGGAVAGGYHTNGVFVGNSGYNGGAGGRSNTGGQPVFVGCVFTANRTTNFGGALCRPKAVTNCVFTANTGNGGAIFAQYTWTADEFSVSRCFFTNNVSSSYGGAIRANSNIFDSEFFGNRSTYGGGAFGQIVAKQGVTALSGCTFTSNTVDYVKNETTRYGGAVTLSGGDVVDCTFVDNLQTNGAGAAICLNGAAGAFRLSGCTFVGNKGKFDGGVVYANNRQTISNCTFTGEMKGYHGVIAKGQNFVDCMISNVSCSGWHFFNCNLTRCSVISNSFETLPLDDTDVTTPGTYTNVNCIFYGNEYNGGMTHFIKYKTLVNCTFAGNRGTSAGNYGTFLYSCIGWNTLFFGNVKDASTPLDLRTKVQGSAVPFEMHNCIFTALDTEVTAEGFDNCSLVPMAKVHCEWKDGRLCLAPRSCAVDAATSPAWLLTAVGSSDVYGNLRFFGAGLDVGAVECQERKPGFCILFK